VPCLTIVQTFDQLTQLELTKSYFSDEFERFLGCFCVIQAAVIIVLTIMDLVL